MDKIELDSLEKGMKIVLQETEGDIYQLTVMDPLERQVKIVCIDHELGEQPPVLIFLKSCLEIRQSFAFVYAGQRCLERSNRIEKIRIVDEFESYD